jgi:hypothetical protein
MGSFLSEEQFNMKSDSILTNNSRGRSAGMDSSENNDGLFAGLETGVNC